MKLLKSPEYVNDTAVYHNVRTIIRDEEKVDTFVEKERYKGPWSQSPSMLIAFCGKCKNIL